MKIRALRGVCIGVNRHLLPGESADLDTAMVAYLQGIGAVEMVPEQPASESISMPEQQPMREKPAKKEK